MPHERVREVVRKVRALQKLTAQTGTITKRSQGLLLQQLTPDELVLAAELLTDEGKTDENRAQSTR